MLVDSHCHLDRVDLAPYEGRLDKVLQEARDVGVEYFLSIGVVLEEAPALLTMAELYSDVSVSIGLHPTENPGFILEKKTLEAFATQPKVAAIGETGLDYYRAEGDMEWQRERFRTHIRVAKECDKPLVVHTRLAKEDTLEILKTEGAKSGVLHCFTEDLDMAKRAIDLNFYISLSGILTFKNAKELQAIAKALPLERLLIETDCPYLAPTPHRGKPNVPAYVRYTAEYLAELREQPLTAIARQTTQNFYTLFNITPQAAVWYTA